MAEKVDTEHPRANEAIDLLRKAAVVMKEVGDELVEANATEEQLRSELSGFEEEIAKLTDYGETHERWETLLEDFRRGIVDKDELLAGTVGK